jgi:hypothetical protein
MTDQFDSLSPRDVVITIRSLGRRLDEISGAARSDEDVFAHLDAVGPSGRSLPDIAISASQAVAFLANEVDRMIDRLEPVVPRAAVEPDERDFGEPPGRATMTDAVAALADEADRIAERLDRLEPSGWARSAAVVGGGRVDLLDLARELARTGVLHVREATHQLAWLREISESQAG